MSVKVVDIYFYFGELLLIIVYHYSSGITGYKYLWSSATRTAFNVNVEMIVNHSRAFPGALEGVVCCLDVLKISLLFPVNKYFVKVFFNSRDFPYSLKWIQPNTQIPLLPWNKRSTSLDLFSY